MRGNNTLQLNKATLIEALQEYFDKRYNPNIKVLNVEKSSTQYDATFDVSVEETMKENSNG